jgi:hypothetical protein
MLGQDCGVVGDAGTGRVSLTLKSVVRESHTREEGWEALMRTPSF